MLNKLAVPAIIAAGVTWGMISIFLRQLAATGLSVEAIVLNRMFFSAIFLGIYLWLFDRNKLRISVKDLWMFIGSGIICLLGFNCCYFYTVLAGYAAVGGVLLYTSPAFIMLFARIFFKEKITITKMAALILTISGCLLISEVISGTEKIPTIILFTGLGSGLLYGLYSIFGKIALRKYSALTVVFYTFLIGTAGGLFFGDLPLTYNLVLEKPFLLMWLAGCSLVCSVLPYFLYTWGLQNTTAGRASILVAVEPLICTLLGFCVYGENFSPVKLAGIAAIICAIILLNIPKRLSLSYAASQQ